MTARRRRQKFRRTFLTLSVLCVTAEAQESEVAFENTCKGLIGLTLPGGVVGAAEFVAATDTLQGHCKVTGKLNQRTGIDGKPYAIGFEVRLPRNWNRRFYFQGGGGTDGVLRPAMGTIPAGGISPNALSSGFAVASTDAGHLNEAGAQGSFLFGADPQARADYGYNHLPTVSAAAKAVIAKVYGAAPERSYFVGCSNGGRQAMMATQRFPELFDGVIASAPAYRVVEASIDAAVQTQLFAAVAPRDPDDKPILGKAFSMQELNVAAKAILQSCDALDGIADGMVNNVRECRFDPARVACTKESSECLAAEKAAALKSAFAGARDTKDQPIYAQWPYDPGIATPLWTSWKLGPEAAMPPRALNTTLVAGALSHVLFTPPELTSDLYGFVLKLDPVSALARAESVAAPFQESGKHAVNADADDLDAFTKRGGKIILYHGMADGIFSPHDTVRYFERLRARYGRRTQSFARLYLIPGMGHCSGGPATDQFDAVSALVAWVETGRAPDAIVAKAGNSSPWPGRTRPLCPYPQQAHFSGRGGNDARSFICK